MEPNSVTLLEARWGQLRLLEEEREMIEVPKDVLKRDIIKWQHSVIGRICNDQMVWKEVIRIIMEKV